jgi:uncharacterized protein (DUF697 family)
VETDDVVHRNAFLVAAAAAAAAIPFSVILILLPVSLNEAVAGIYVSESSYSGLVDWCCSSAKKMKPNEKDPHKIQ